MVLAGPSPTVASFPSVQSFPDAGTSPTFGLTSEEQTLQALVPGIAPAPTTIATPQNPVEAAHANVMNWLSGMTGGAISGANDPTGWTPEEAAGQTDRALARIAEVNPELAKTLAANRDPNAVQDTGEDLPWWKDIMHGVGSVLHATHLDTVIDLLGRPAHIVPEILLDNKDSVWQNIGDALLGKSDVSWDDVLVEKFGMERNGLTAALGLMGDLATDPLTYLTFGAGGVSREIIGKTVGTAGIEAALREGTVAGSDMLVEAIARQAPKEALEAAGSAEKLAANAIMDTTSAGTALAERANNTIVARLRAAITGVHPDMAAGAWWQATQKSEREALQDLIKIGDNAFTASTTSGWARVTADAAEKLGLNKQYVDEILKETVARGTGFVEKGLYQEGKAAAGALGGIRFRMSAFGFRVAGQRLPLISPRLDFSIGRRFFAGLSGQTRLLRMVGNNEAPVEALQFAWKNGYKALGERFPAVQQQLGSGAHNLGSIFYSLSEGVGHFTEHFAPGHQVLRGGGLGALYASDTRKLAGHIQQEGVNDIMSNVTTEGVLETPDVVSAGILNPIKGLDAPAAEQFYGKLDEYFLALNRGDDEAAARIAEDIAQYDGGEEALDYASGVAQRADEVTYRSGGRPSATGEDPLARHDLLPEDLAATQVARSADYQGRTWRVGGLVHPLSTGDRPLSTKTLATDNADELVGRGVWLEETTGRTEAAAAASSEEELRRALDASIEEESSSQALAEGQAILERSQPATADMDIHALTTGRVQVVDPEDVKAAVNPDIGVFPGPVYKVDRSPAQPGQTLSATENIDHYKEVEDEVDTLLDAVAQGKADEDIAALLPKDDKDLADAIKLILSDETNRVAQKSDLISRIFKSEGYSGIEVTDVAAGQRRTRLLLFGESDGLLPMARANPAAQALGAHASPLRAFTPATERALVNKSGKSLVAKMLRQTQGMSLDEAEAYVRRQLHARNLVLPEGAPVFSRDLKDVLTRHVEGAAKAAKDRYVGRLVQKAEHLGLSRSAFAASAVGHERLRYVLNETGIKALASADAETKTAAKRAALAHNATDLKHLEAMAHERNAAVKVAEDALQETDDLVAERTHALLAQIGPGQEEMFPADYVTKQIAGSQKLFDALNAGGKSVRLGDNIFRSEGTRGTYYHYVKDGKVQGHFLVSPADQVLETGLDDETRNLMRSVTAMVDPAAQRAGIAQQLRDAYFAEAGIDSLAKLEKFVGGQTFSAKGAKFTKATVEEFAAKARKAAKSELASRRLLAGKARAAFERGRLEHVESMNEINSLLTRSETQRAPVLKALLPLDQARGQAGMEVLNIPGFGGHAMPTFMAQELKRAVSGPQGLNAAHKHFRQLNAWWKDQVTWLWPGFHLRNFEGGVFNNWLGGVDIKDYFTAGRMRRAANEVAHGKAGKWSVNRIADYDGDLVDSMLRHGQFTINGVPVKEATYLDLAMESGGLNITAANGRLFAEARLEFEQGRQSKRLAERVRLPGTDLSYAKGAKAAGTLTENVLRSAAWARGLRDHGHVMEARAFTMMRHGDYEDLTDWEYGWVRDLIPFYKWMRTNVPFQVHQLLESPAKLLAAQKAQGAVFTAAGRDYDEDRYRMPEWMRESFNIPLPGSKGDNFNALMLDLPMSDLFMGGREFLSSMLPMVRPLLESYVIDQNIFTGAPIEGKPVQLSSALALGPLRGFLQTVGLAKKGEDGNVYINDRTQNLFGLIPVFSRMKNWIYEDPDRAKLRANTFISAGLGLSLRPVDSSAMVQNELDYYYSQVLPAMDWLKGTGTTLPTSADIEGIVGDTDTVLTSLGITPGSTQYAATAAAGGTY